ncbi:hypothetical protein BH18CHL2_BH18CHL2_00720 [soil metagenome]
MVKSELVVRALAVLAISLAASFAAFGSVAEAAAGPNASCIGLGSSNAKTDPDGPRSAIAHLIKENFAQFGADSPGGVYSLFARLPHAGSVEACFEDFD